MPGGNTEICASIKELKDTGMVVLTMFHFNSPIQLREKTGLLRMTVNYQKGNKAMAAVAVTVVVPLLEQIFIKLTKFTSALGAVFGLSYVFFSVSVHKDHQKQLPSNWQGH